MNKDIQDILNSNSASFWLQNALRSALDRDCVDAANDAQVLSDLLNARATSILGG